MGVKLVTDKKIALSSSKGNQEKWLDNGIWYKLDQFGYEALAEAVTSEILKKSNIENENNFSFVRYKIEKVNIHNVDRIACTSENFLRQNQAIITLNKLLSNNLKISLTDKIGRLTSDKKRIQYLVDATKDITGLADFDKYLTLLFEIDSMIMNDDRHLNNIAVLEKDGKFDYCPIFDNGAGLLSNTQIYRMDIEPKGIMKTMVASPFLMTFNREVKTVYSLYGEVLKIPKFTKSEIEEIVNEFLEFYPERDRAIIKERVIQCIIERQKIQKS
ncbi:MAG: hypothetical protein PUF01_06730 [Eubacteriales bacterium]|nr:hypothetical protein [Eubacteriales bacterium]